MTFSYPEATIRPRAPLAVQTIPGGDAGIFATLREMRRLARASLGHPVVQLAAQDATQGAPDTFGQWAGIRAWLRRFTTFASDPHAFSEVLFTPDEQFHKIGRDGVLAADCDDVALLAASLVLAVGGRVRFTVVGFGAPTGWAAMVPFRHVYAEQWTPAGWRDYDLTRTTASPTPMRRASMEV